jgi:hypothetical protein
MVSVFGAVKHDMDQSDVRTKRLTHFFVEKLLIKERIKDMNLAGQLGVALL